MKRGGKPYRIVFLPAMTRLVIWRIILLPSRRALLPWPGWTAN